MKKQTKYIIIALAIIALLGGGGLLSIVNIELYGCDENNTDIEVWGYNYEPSPGSGAIWVLAQEFTVPPDKDRLTVSYVEINGYSSVVPTGMAFVGIATVPDVSVANWLSSDLKIFTGTGTKIGWSAGPDGFDVTPGETYYYMIATLGDKGIKFGGSTNEYCCPGLNHAFIHSQQGDEAWFDYYYDLTFSIGIGTENDPPVCNGVSGPSSGVVGTQYSFSASGSDPDFDPLEYYFDWGDGETTGWQSSTSANHIWNSEDTFQIRAKCRDNWGEESGWCSNHPIIITDGGSDPIQLPKPTISASDCQVGIQETFTVTVTTSATPSDFAIEAYVRDSQGNYLVPQWTTLTKTGPSGNTYTATKSYTCNVVGTVTIGARAVTLNPSDWLTSPTETTTVQCTDDPQGDIDYTFIVTGGGFMDGPLATAQVTFDGSTKQTDSNGKAIFANLESGSSTLIVGLSGYKQLTATVSIIDDRNVYVTLAPIGSSDASSWSFSPIDSYGFILSLLVLAVMIIATVVLLLIFKPNPKTLGITVILWMIYIILLLLNIVSFPFL